MLRRLRICEGLCESRRLTERVYGAGMCVSEEFEVRVRLCTHSPQQPEQDKGQAGPAAGTSTGAEGAREGEEGQLMLEPVIENTDEIDRMLTYLR